MSSNPPTILSKADIKMDKTMFQMTPTVENLLVSQKTNVKSNIAVSSITKIQLDELSTLVPDFREIINTPKVVKITKTLNRLDALAKIMQKLELMVFDEVRVHTHLNEVVRGLNDSRSHDVASDGFFYNCVWRPTKKISITSKTPVFLPIQRRIDGGRRRDYTVWRFTSSRSPYAGLIPREILVRAAELHRELKEQGIGHSFWVSSVELQRNTKSRKLKRDLVREDPFIAVVLNGHEINPVIFEYWDEPGFSIIKPY